MQVLSCKMKPRSGIILILSRPPTYPTIQLPNLPTRSEGNYVPCPHPIISKLLCTGFPPIVFLFVGAVLPPSFLCCVSSLPYCTSYMSVSTPVPSPTHKITKNDNVCGVPALFLKKSSFCPAQQSQISWLSIVAVAK